MPATAAAANFDFLAVNMIGSRRCTGRRPTGGAL
jgi:hypothetical protein